MSKQAIAGRVQPAQRDSHLPFGAHDAVLSLNEDGVIVEATSTAEALFGYGVSGELVGRHISFLLPELARFPLLRNAVVNPRLAFLCHCGKRFTAARREGWAFFAELFINKVEGRHGPVLMTVKPAASAHITPEPRTSQQWESASAG